MKLFLCSLGINSKEALQTLFAKPLSEIRCGVIKNPMDLKTLEKRKFLYGLVDSSFVELGINKIDIDLREYEGKSKELKDVINDLDMLWITGGNVFYLRWLIKKVEFGPILLNAVKGGLVYGGDSAGALVVCPTLKYLDMVDDTSQIPEVIFKGLNIIDFIPLPHWDNVDFKSKLIEIREKLENDGFKVLVFGDKQSVVVNGENVEIVGQLMK